MKYLSPISFFKFLISYIKEFRVFFFYRATINSLIISREFEKVGLRVDKLKRIFFVKNLDADVLLFNGNQGSKNVEELEKFEKNLVVQELVQYNDFFIRNQLIELVKTSLKRIKTKDFYAYLVIIHFRFKEITVRSTFYLFSYIIGFIYLVIKLISLKPYIIQLLDYHKS